MNQLLWKFRLIGNNTCMIFILYYSQHVPDVTKRAWLEALTMLRLTCLALKFNFLFEEWEHQRLNSGSLGRRGSDTMSWTNYLKFLYCWVTTYEWFYISNMRDLCCSPLTLQGSASRWSASRIRTEVEDKFDAIKAAKEGLPILFTGEVEYKEFHFSLLFTKHLYLLHKYYICNVLFCFDSSTYAKLSQTDFITSS
jgi:hypothetical protein